MPENDPQNTSIEDPLAPDDIIVFSGKILALFATRMEGKQHVHQLEVLLTQLWAAAFNAGSTGRFTQGYTLSESRATAMQPDLALAIHNAAYGRAPSWEFSAGSSKITGELTVTVSSQLALEVQTKILTQNPGIRPAQFKERFRLEFQRRVVDAIERLALARTAMDPNRVN